MLKKAITPGSFLKNYLFTLLIVFLPLFMFGVFGPSEIFFGNYSEFGFIYREFGWKFLGISVVLALFIALILQIVPKFPRTLILSVLWGFTIAGYIQTMFLNKNLDQIGVSAEGYTANATRVILNALFWLVILAASVLICVFKKDLCTRLLTVTSSILLGIQIVGFVSLFLTADASAMAYNDTDGELSLSGAGQYTLSSNENIILFVLDNFSNTFWDEALAAYPDMTDSLSDFTYYNNADCAYWGTYPSLAHMLTGNPLDTGLSVNDWLNQCWNNDSTNTYYKLLEKHNYKVNLYTPVTSLLTGTDTLELLQGKIDNVGTESSSREIDYEKLNKTMLQMSCYRFLPEYFKPQFDVNNSQYTSIVSYPDNEMMYSNYSFYEKLQDTGLSLDSASNYFTIQHLNGTHEFVNDENCAYDPDNATCATTVKGIFTMLDAYLQQLKDLGIYDNSTIIITADHGSEARSQMIFFMKGKNETHDSMQTTNAPISLNDLVPTIVEAIGEDYAPYGQSVHDFSADESRERSVYIRVRDDAYPAVKRFDGVTEGGMNAYHVYTYYGTLKDLVFLYDNGYYTPVQVIDSYF